MPLRGGTIAAPEQQRARILASIAAIGNLRSVFAERAAVLRSELDECQRSREMLEATDSRFAWHDTASARCGLAFSVRLLDQGSNARLLGFSDCPELYMAQLRASALQQAQRIDQARALEETEVDPRAEGHDVGIAIDHLARPATVRSRLLAKANHFAGIRMDLENESPDTLHYGS